MKTGNHLCLSSQGCSSSVNCTYDANIFAVICVFVETSRGYELNFTKIYQVQNMQYKTMLWVLLTLSCSDPKPQQADHLRYVVLTNLTKLGQA